MSLPELQTLKNLGKATNGAIEFYQVGPNGEKLKLIRRVEKFPVTQRPWYKVALNHEKLSKMEMLQCHCQDRLPYLDYYKEIIVSQVVQKSYILSLAKNDVGEILR